MGFSLDDQRDIVLDRPDGERGIHVGISGPGSFRNAERSDTIESNKGSMNGQFSPEFLHRPVWRGLVRGLRRR
jgi:hypothetical protein